MNIDVRLSTRIYQLELGLLDYLFAPTAIAFGLPVTLFGSVIPLCIYASSMHSAGTTGYLLGSCLVGILYSILTLLSDAKAGGFCASVFSSQNAVIAVICYHFLCTWYLLFNVNGGGRYAAMASVLFFTQEVNQLLKKLVRRPRPSKSIVRARLTDIRAWSVNEELVAKEGMPMDTESFPSGDGAQAGALCYAAYLFGANGWVCCVATALSVWGRVYFGCHWLFDAVAGAVQGGLCTLSINAFLALDTASWSSWYIIVSLVLYEAAEAARKKLFSY